jgi:regulator of sigma E protease
LLISILALIVVLGITVTVHEFGHFAMAKLLKIRVLVFSLGFGPKILGFTHKGTEYRISPIPLGGYVKMAGETLDDDRSGDPEEFLSHPRWHRFLVAVSGPMMNILLALIIAASSYMHGVYVPKYQQDPAIIGPVAANSPARTAGLRTGDYVISINRNRISTWLDLEVALETAPRDSLNFEVSRNNQILQLHIAPPKDEKNIAPITLGFRVPVSRTIVDSVSDNRPAIKAGMQAGDEIVSIRKKDQIGTNYSEILNIISESKGIPLDFEIRRPNSNLKKEDAWGILTPSNSRIFHITITPIEENGHVIIGFNPDVPVDFQKFGFGRALVQSANKNYKDTVLTFTYIGRILKGSASVKSLSGPIGIAKMSGDVARSAALTGSARVFIGFLGMISLQLGVFNLLPIPILDGGVIALLFLEGLIRRDLSIKLKEKIVQTGFVFLILLMGFVIFNDLSKLINLDQLFRR